MILLKCDGEELWKIWRVRFVQLAISSPLVLIFLRLYVFEKPFVASVVDERKLSLMRSLLEWADRHVSRYSHWWGAKLLFHNFLQLSKSCETRTETARDEINQRIVEASQNQFQHVVYLTNGRKLQNFRTCSCREGCSRVDWVGCNIG